MSQLNPVNNTTCVWETAGEGTIFGFNQSELRENLVSDADFRARFDEHFDMMTLMMKEIKAEEKAKMKALKDENERKRLIERLNVIENIDGCRYLGEKLGNMSNADIKKWIKDYKDNAKKAKAEAADKVKQEKERAQREALKKKMTKIDVTIENSDEMDIDELSSMINDLTIRKKEEKDSITRQKYIKTLNKIISTIEGIPEFESEKISMSDLKHIHVRSKLLFHLAKLNDPLDYDNTLDNKALKTRLDELKTTVSAN